LSAGDQAARQLHHSAPPYPRGELNFTGNFTHDADPNNDSGLGAADFLLGALDTSILSSFIDDTFQQPGSSYFVQDDFKGD